MFSLHPLYFNVSIILLTFDFYFLIWDIDEPVKMRAILDTNSHHCLCVRSNSKRVLVKRTLEYNVSTLPL